MNALKKSHLLLALSMAIAHPALANSASPYPTLHNSQEAESAYKRFASGTGNDPFADLAHGYRSGYALDVDMNIKPQQHELMRARAIKQFESNAEYFSNVSSLRDEQRASLYNKSFDGDGKFDPVVYAQLYATFLDGEKSQADMHMREGFSNLMSIMNENNTALNSLSFSVSDQTTQATTNLINAMGSNSHQSKMAMYELYASSMSNASSMASQATNTLAVASSFSDDCGSACSFPEQPPVVDPEDPPEDPPSYTPPINVGCGAYWDEVNNIWYQCR